VKAPNDVDLLMGTISLYSSLMATGFTEKLAAAIAIEAEVTKITNGDLRLTHEINRWLMTNGRILRSP
jgi:hypothetical protein